MSAVVIDFPSRQIAASPTDEQRLRQRLGELAMTAPAQLLPMLVAANEAMISGAAQAIQQAARR